MEIHSAIDYFGNRVYVPDQPQIDIQHCLQTMYYYQELEKECAERYGVTVGQLVACAPKFTTLETEEKEVDTNEDTED